MHLYKEMGKHATTASMTRLELSDVSMIPTILFHLLLTSISRKDGDIIPSFNGLYCSSSKDGTGAAHHQEGSTAHMLINVKLN